MLRPSLISVRIVLYGTFLVVCGLIGFVLTSEHSTSSLANGIVGGLLMIVLGVMHNQKRPFTLPASIGAAGIFTLTFIWRSIVQWKHALDSAEFVPLAVLLTIMMIVSSLMLSFLIRNSKL